MNTTKGIRLEHLGQTGLRIDHGGLTVLVDPYLSNSVQELDSPDLVRQIPIAYKPNELKEVDWVLILMSIWITVILIHCQFWPRQIQTHFLWVL